MSFAREKFERRFTDVSYDLLISKTFYFFFYAAFGSDGFRCRFNRRLTYMLNYLNRGYM